ncbi:ribosome hibernation-promoting factor, HPF/YfiA family [Maricaulis parjimensis]|uniref:ribosome hibernation-promoting factor, HPF/YfiA family n=1 Tax=Maricaulis parjimensis TaxID=144023 RepID=UPI001939AE81|nr:ribosome-associated translation inhibitor RaiA [Maricaulis parjimensis]
MQIQVVNKGIDVSDALREQILGRVEDGVTKYFNRPGEAYVSISREGVGFRVDCSLHLPSGAMLQAHGSADDAYKAAVDTMERLEKRLRRYKRKLKNHHNANKAELPAESMPILVLQGSPDNGLDDDYDEQEDSGAPANGAPEPIVIAERPGEMRTLTVGMASLELEAADSPFLMFRNAASGGLNIVYRRPDGHIGWLDPSRTDTAKSA